MNTVTTETIEVEQTSQWPEAGPKIRERPPRRRPVVLEPVLTPAPVPGVGVEAVNVEGTMRALPVPAIPLERPDRTALAVRTRHLQTVAELEQARFERDSAEDLAVWQESYIAKLEAELRMRPVDPNPIVELLATYGPSSGHVIGQTLELSREERNKALAWLCGRPEGQRLVDFMVLENGTRIFHLVERSTREWFPTSEDDVVVEAELVEEVPA